MDNTNNPDYTTPQPEGFDDGVRMFNDFMARNPTPDNPEQEEPIEKVFADLAELSKICEKLGVFIINPPQPLAEAAADYYNVNSEAIREQFERGGARPDTITAVIQDYGRALFGIYPFRATFEQINDALTCVTPVQAFTTDRFVLFLGVMRPYAAITRFYDEYQRNVKQEADAAKRQTWFENEPHAIPSTEAVAFQWMQHNGYIVVSDFAGVEQEVIRHFLNRMEQKADVGNYVRYYAVARLGLMATPEQVAAVDPPRQFGARNSATQYAEDIVAEISRDFNAKAAKIADFVNKAATGQTPPTEIVREAKEATNAIVRVPEKFALILSRDIYTADGKDAKNILPISRYIEAYLKKRGTDAVYITTSAGERRVTVTPRTVEKAIEGVNLLQHFHKATPANGVLRFETNLTEFSELCGYKDANDEEKLQLLASLMVVNDLYLVVWRSGGLHAVNLLHIPDIGLTGRDKGNFVILVNEDAMRGKPQLISITDFVRLKQLAKGQAKNHFRYQILAKGQSEERALVSQVFGYQYKLDELKDRPDELAKAHEYIRKHRSRDAKTLQTWFDEYAQLGFISYTRTRNAKGEWIYKWRRLTAPTPEELADVERGKLDTLLLKPSDVETDAANDGE